MLKDISLGRYYSGNSIFHELDPRIKVVMFFTYMVTIFTVNKWQAMVLFSVITIAQIVIAKLPLKVIISSIMPVVPIALFIALLNMLTIREGRTLFEWNIIVITLGGTRKAILMASRLILLIISTSVLLTLTTTPLKLSDALEKLFAPLKVIKMPVHEMAMMMSIALRFIPTLVEETDRIMKAQVSRGADYDTGTIIARTKGYITVIIPLFISAFKRAEELATAMDARCYRGGEGRTKLNPLHLTSKDWITGAILLVLAALVLVLQVINV